MLGQGQVAAAVGPGLGEQEGHTRLPHSLMQKCQLQPCQSWTQQRFYRADQCALALGPSQAPCDPCSTEKHSPQHIFFTYIVFLFKARHELSVEPGLVSDQIGERSVFGILGQHHPQGARRPQVAAGTPYHGPGKHHMLWHLLQLSDSCKSPNTQQGIRQPIKLS